jgi:hypothetical protein
VDRPPEDHKPELVCKNVVSPAWHFDGHASKITPSKEGLWCLSRSSTPYSPTCLGVLHLVQLRRPRQWVDSTGRDRVQFTAAVR